MKSAMIVVLLAGLTLTSGVSAMTMTDDAMMKKDSAMMKDDKMTSGSMDKTMMKDTMMKDKMMMSDDKMMMKKSTASLANAMGYTWSQDRTTLASNAGIIGYRGTAKQNTMIRSYLMGMMKDKMAMKDSAMMKDDKMMKDTMAK